MNDIDLAKAERHLGGAMAALNELTEMAEDPKVKPGSKKWVQKRDKASHEMTLAQQGLGLNAVEAI